MVRVSRINCVSAHSSKWKEAGNYLIRTGSAALGPDGVPVLSPGDVTASWYAANDTVLYKIVVSMPAGTATDISQLARAAMLRTGNDMRGFPGTKGDLEWIAAPHYDSDNPHVHIVLRGRAAGERFSIKHADLAHVMKRHIAAYAAEIGLHNEPQKVISRVHQNQPDMDRQN